MLKKLIKHDIRALMPWYGFATLACLITALLTRISISTGTATALPQNEALGDSYVSSVAESLVSFTSLGFAISCLVLTVICTLLPLLRFYRNYFKDEGYLMFTLPVTPKQLYFSKFIVAVLSSVYSTAVIVISLLIGFYTPGIARIFTTTVESLQGLINASYAGISPTVIGILDVLNVIELILSPLLSAAMMFAAVTLGHLFPKHPVGYAVLSYFGISIAMSTLSDIALSLSSLIAVTQTGAVNQLAAELIAQSALSLLISFLFTALLIGTSIKIMEKRLNLA